MKKAMVFISAFALVLISGAAVAFMTTPGADAGHADAYEKDDATTTSTTIHEKDEPLEYPEKDEPAEPTKDEGDHEKPKDEEKPDEEKPDEEVDDDPPDLIILFPENGQHFEEKEVPFEGKTEPGAKVYVNGNAAEVDEEGNWRIVLALDKGANEIYVKAFDQAGNWSKVWTTVHYDPPAPPEPPKEEPPKDYEFWATQKYGSCSENPPYDKWYGMGEPGTEISITSEFGSGHTVIGESGEWWLKVYFSEETPCNEAFLVTLKASGEPEKHYEFIRLCEEDGHDGK